MRLCFVPVGLTHPRQSPETTPRWAISFGVSRRGYGTKSIPYGAKSTPTRLRVDDTYLPIPQVGFGDSLPLPDRHRSARGIMGSGLFISRVRLITAQSPQGAFTLARPCTNYERNRIYQSHFPVSDALQCRDWYDARFIGFLSARRPSNHVLPPLSCNRQATLVLEFSGSSFVCDLPSRSDRPSIRIQRFGDFRLTPPQPTPRCAAIATALMEGNSQCFSLYGEYYITAPVSWGEPSLLSHLTRKTITGRT